MSLNISVPVFIHLPANVKTSTLVKAKINRLPVCKFTLSHCLLIQGLNHSPSFHFLSLSIDERWHFCVSLGEVLGQVVQGSSRTSSECHHQFLAVRSNHLVCLGGWMLSQGLASTPFCHSPTVHLCRHSCCGRRSTPGVPQDGCPLYSDTGSPTGICCLPDFMLAGLGGQDTPCFYLPSIEITPMHAPHSLTSSVSIRAQTQILCL